MKSTSRWPGVIRGLALTILISAGLRAPASSRMHGVLVGADRGAVCSFVTDGQQILRGSRWDKGEEGEARSLAVVPGSRRFFVNVKLAAGGTVIRSFSVIADGQLKLTSETAVEGSWGPIVISPDGRRLVLIDRGGGMQAFHIRSHGLAKAATFKASRWQSDRFWTVSRPDQKEFLLVHVLRMVMNELPRAEKLRWGKELYPQTVPGTQINEEAGLWTQKGLDDVLLLQDGSLLVRTMNGTERCVFGRRNPKFFPVTGFHPYGLAGALPDGTALAWSQEGGLGKWGPGKLGVLKYSEPGIPWGNGELRTRWIWGFWHDKGLSQAVLLTNSGLELINDPLGRFSLGASLHFDKMTAFTASAFINSADDKTGWHLGYDPT